MKKNQKTLSVKLKKFDQTFMDIFLKIAFHKKRGIIKKYDSKLTVSAKNK